MSNTHEYVVFDRAKVDRALSMRWPAFDLAFEPFSQWNSSRDFLVEWGLDESDIDRVDEIVSRKTVRATMRMNSSPFQFLIMILHEKGLVECSVDIEKGDYTYADDIVGCAGIAFVRGVLSRSSLWAVLRLHAGWAEFDTALPIEATDALSHCTVGPPMIPGVGELPPGAGGVGVSDSRRVIAFLLQAWGERWPLKRDETSQSRRATIRDCKPAAELVRRLRKRQMASPCICRWYEC